MMKRLIALAALLALLLCACGTQTGDNSTTEPSGTTTAPTGTTADPTGTTAKPSDPVDDGKKTYTVTVVDQNNKPVAGVAVQFCDEKGSCQLPVKTNDQGVITKSLAPMVYHVKLTLPQGYSCDTLEYTLDGITELKVTVTAG